MAPSPACSAVERAAVLSAVNLAARANIRRVALLATTAAVFIAGAAIVAAAEPTDASSIGQIGAFSLNDAQGATHTFAECKGAKCTLLLFIDTECPVSNFYTPQMQRWAAKYGPRGVTCFGVHSNPATTTAAAAQHAKEYGLKFPVLIDPAQQLAQAAGVRVTPEAVVISPQGKVLYRGRLDDRYSLDGKRRDEPRQRDLEAAVDAVLAGREPEVRETKAFGCPLPKPKATDR